MLKEFVVTLWLIFSMIIIAKLIFHMRDNFIPLSALAKKIWILLADLLLIIIAFGVGVFLYRGWYPFLILTIPTASIIFDIIALILLGVTTAALWNEKDKELGTDTLKLTDIPLIIKDIGLIRSLMIILVRTTQWYWSIIERANYTEVGYFGYVSSVDEDVVKKKQLKPLNRFEKWLLVKYIYHEKTRRQRIWEDVTKDL